MARYGTSTGKNADGFTLMDGRHNAGVLHNLHQGWRRRTRFPLSVFSFSLKALSMFPLCRVPERSPRPAATADLQGTIVTEEDTCYSCSSPNVKPNVGKNDEPRFGTRLSVNVSDSERAIPRLHASIAHAAGASVIVQ